MKLLKLFAVLIVVALCSSSFTLYGATRTLDEINSEQQKKKEEEEKKAAEEAKKKEEEAKAKKAAEEKRKAEEEAKKKEADKKAAEAAKQAEQPEPNYQVQTTAQTVKTYIVAEDVIGLPKQLVMLQVDNNALMNADPKTVKLYETAVIKEKEKDILKNPAEIIKLWNQLAGITQNNPFAEAAKSRLHEWHSAVALLNKHQESLDKISKLIPTNIIPTEQKVSIVLQHLDEFGITFGTDEILSITTKSSAAAEIAKNETFRRKIKEILNARCNHNSGKDCFSSGKYFAANEEEKIAHFTKACELKYHAGCDEVKKIKMAAEAEKARIAAEEKRKVEEARQKAEAEQERRIKEELNHAGRKKRLTIATSTLVSGVVVGVLGGVSFYGMSKAKKKRDKYLDSYRESTTQAEMDYFRKKTNNADSKRKTYLILGGVGIGVGAALMVTGITFYSIEFEGEKEVKKKYNLSFGASPMGGTFNFALNW